MPLFKTKLMKNYKILYKLTTRSRPDKAIATIDNIYIHQSFTSKFHIHVTLDSNDETCNNETFIDKLKKYTNLTFTFGESKNKVEAINRDVDKIDYEWDILVNMSDDMYWHHEGFDQEIRRAYMQFFPDLDGAVHFPDGNQNERIITLAIVGRKYYDRFKYIYNPEYISLWCDQEFTDVAKALGKYAYVSKSLYRHMHPAWGLAPMDAQYQYTESFESADKLTYLKRQANGFA